MWLVTVWQWCHTKTLALVPRIKDKRKEKKNKLESKLYKSNIITLEEWIEFKRTSSSSIMITMMIKIDTDINDNKG